MERIGRFLLSWIFFLTLGYPALGQIVTQNQLAPSAQSGGDLNLTISAAQGWTDTGLDLHPGDLVEISAMASPAEGAAGTAGQACDPAGNKNSSQSGLPLSSAPAGALIAKLSTQSPTPVLVGAQQQLKIDQAGHLFLGGNTFGQASCQGNFAVKVHVAAANAAQAAAPTSIKSKLSAAAGTWLSGQLGTSAGPQPTPAGTGIASAPPTTGAAANPAPSGPALAVSTTPLDAKLRDEIDHLPRRVNDQLNNLGDMVNFVIIGNEKDVQSALEASNWFVADTNNSEAVAKAVLMTYKKKDYLQMPMSILYLFSRPQDFGYEMAEPYSVVASRHHFRIWKAPFTYNGQEVWVGAGTHDIGFEKDQRNGSVTHKIDPAVDGERENIGASLQKSGHVQSMWYYLPPNPVQDAKNATGGGYHSDGRILVISLKGAPTPAAKVAP